MTLSFSKLNDDLGVFSKEEIERIEQRVDEISKESELDIYINTYKVGKNTQLKVLEKSVIIDMIKVDNNNLTVKLNFTQDVDISPYQEEIENILGNLGDLILEGENEKYTIDLLGSLEDVFKRMAEDQEVQKDKFSGGKKPNKFLIFLISFVITLSVIKRKEIKRIVLSVIKKR
jgi:hypothetical protein